MMISRQMYKKVKHRKGRRERTNKRNFENRKEIQQEKKAVKKENW